MGTEAISIYERFSGITLICTFSPVASRRTPKQGLLLSKGGKLTVRPRLSSSVVTKLMHRTKWQTRRSQYLFSYNESSGKYCRGAFKGPKAVIVRRNMPFLTLVFKKYAPSNS
jgi:hypothetical protein